MTTDEELRLQAENLDLRRLLQQAGIDAAEHQTVEKIQSVLVAELHHRIKNLLATVSAIVSQSLRHAKSTEEGRLGIESRIAALGRVQDLLLRANWKSARLTDIIRTGIEPFDRAGEKRFVVQVTDIQAAAAASLPLALAINELCTNAVKYGALSNAQGHVEITAVADNEKNSFRFTWREVDGPPVARPTHSGFGTRLIQQSFVSQLNGAVRLTYEPSGVTCEIDVPLQVVVHFTNK